MCVSGSAAFPTVIYPSQEHKPNGPHLFRQRLQGEIGRDKQEEETPPPTKKKNGN